MRNASGRAGGRRIAASRAAFVVLGDPIVALLQLLHSQADVGLLGKPILRPWIAQADEVARQPIKCAGAAIARGARNGGAMALKTLFVGDNAFSMAASQALQAAGTVVGVEVKEGIAEKQVRNDGRG